MGQHVKAPPAMVAALAAQGHSQATIGTMLGVSRERIRQICDRDGIETLPGQKDYDAIDRAASVLAESKNIYVAELAEKAGVSYQVALAMIRRGDIEKPVSPFKWRKIAECAEQGMSLSATARHLGITAQQAWTQANAHGIVFTAKEKRGRPFGWRKAAQ